MLIYISKEEVEELSPAEIRDLLQVLVRRLGVLRPLVSKTELELQRLTLDTLIAEDRRRSPK